MFKEKFFVEEGHQTSKWKKKIEVESIQDPE